MTVDGDGKLVACGLWCRRGRAFVLRLGEMVFCLLAFVCVQSTVWCEKPNRPRCSEPVNTGVYHFFGGVMITSFIWNLLTIMIFLTKLHKKLPVSNWHLLEWINATIFTILTLIASLVLSGNTADLASMTAASILGFLAFIVYSFHLVAEFFLWRRIRVATEEESEDSEGHSSRSKSRDIFDGKRDDSDDSEHSEAEPTLSVVRKRSSMEELDTVTSAQVTKEHHNISNDKPNIKEPSDDIHTESPMLKSENLFTVSLTSSHSSDGESDEWGASDSPLSDDRTANSDDETEGAVYTVSLKKSSPPVITSKVELDI